MNKRASQRRDCEARHLGWLKRLPAERRKAEASAAPIKSEWADKGEFVCFALLAFFSGRARAIGLTVAFANLSVLGYLFQPGAAIPQFYTSFMPLAFCTGAWLGWWTLQGKISRAGGNTTALFCAACVAGLLQGFAWPGGHAEDGFAFLGRLEPGNVPQSLFKADGDQYCRGGETSNPGDRR